MASLEPAEGEGGGAEMLIWIGTGLLVIVGGIGLVIYSCLYMAKRADEQIDRMLKAERAKARR